MELYQEILAYMLYKYKIEISFSGLGIVLDKTLELKCYKTLQMIRDILNDKTLSDADCFECIEKIVCVYEDMGCECGGRHDFV